MLMERALLAAGEKDYGRLEESLGIYRRIFDENCTYHVTPYTGDRGNVRRTEAGKGEACSVVE